MVLGVQKKWKIWGFAFFGADSIRDLQKSSKNRQKEAGKSEKGLKGLKKTEKGATGRPFWGLQGGPAGKSPDQPPSNTT